MATDTELLSDCRKAWRSKREAERKLAHLAQYRRHTPGMKDESRSASRRKVDAESTLEAILGVGPCQE